MIYYLGLKDIQKLYLCGLIDIKGWWLIHRKYKLLQVLTFIAHYAYLKNLKPSYKIFKNIIKLVAYVIESLLFYRN